MMGHQHQIVKKTNFPCVCHVKVSHCNTKLINENDIFFKNHHAKFQILALNDTSIAPT
jgi:hypothetical protein